MGLSTPIFLSAAGKGMQALGESGTYGGTYRNLPWPAKSKNLNLRDDIYMRIYNRIDGPIPLYFIAANRALWESAPIFMTGRSNLRHVLSRLWLLMGIVMWSAFEVPAIINCTSSRHCKNSLDCSLPIDSSMMSIG